MLACRSVMFFLIDRFLTSVFRSTTVYGYDIILIIIIIYKAHVEIRSFIPTLSLSLSFCRTLHSPDIWRSTIEPHELLKTHSCFNFWSRNLLFFPCICFNLVFSLFFSVDCRNRTKKTNHIPRVLNYNCRNKTISIV